MTKVRCILNDDIYIHDAGYVQSIIWKIVRKFMWG